jgi:hypothetical protein
MGEAQVSALVVFQQGRTKEVRDSEVMRVGPIVTVALADQGRLEDGGGAAVIDVTEACPVGSTGQQSSVFLYPCGPVDAGAYEACLALPERPERRGVDHADPSPKRRT